MPRTILQRRVFVCHLLFLGLLVAAAPAAEGQLPPPGIEIPSDVAERLRAETGNLRQRIAAFQAKPHDEQWQKLLPDIEILVKAVEYAVRGNEFYKPAEFAAADKQLALARTRLDELEQGRHPWTSAHGLVVRGFSSQLDGAPQPYGLVIPEGLDLTRPCRLYVWLHGRGDQMLDLQFIAQRLKDPGQIRPSNAIVLHPFGRYCNGYKSAGEVDVLEAVEAVCDAYTIDRDRIVLCGFSMGGAGVWHLGAHYPDRWAVMSPGAGFVDVRRYQHLAPEQFPAWYEQVLWNVYDVPSYTRNLLNLPLVAYSGELDKQKQAADIMEAALAEEGLKMTHIVGPGVAHKYEPAALATLLERLAQVADGGVNRHPREIHLQTRTLRYARCHWIQALGLHEHWCDARVDAARDDAHVTVTTENVTRLRMDCPWAERPAGMVTVQIDGTALPIAPELWERGVTLEQHGAGWQAVSAAQSATSPAKLSGLQGPIDDALLRPFLVVRPTGTAAHPDVEHWVQAELATFRNRWRTLFRGEFREVDDRDVTDAQLTQYNLILWGDPAANSVLRRVLPQLPIGWDQDAIRIAGTNWDASTHVLSMIYPNPLPGARGRYVVLNSGMTFRAGHDRTNSLQNPKLPDWAVIDLTVPPGDLTPGRIADAGFFDEHWQYQQARSVPAAARD